MMYQKKTNKQRTSLLIIVSDLKKKMINFRGGYFSDFPPGEY